MKIADIVERIDIKNRDKEFTLSKGRTHILFNRKKEGKGWGRSVGFVQKVLDRMSYLEESSRLAEQHGGLELRAS